jgi:hypothetical protein
MAGVLLVVLGGVATVVDFLHADGMELLPLMAGLALLLLSAVRQQPLALGFLLLLLLCLRAYLYEGERYFSSELTLTDYSLVLISCTATLGRRLNFWNFYLRLFAVLIPLAGILSLGLDQSRLPGSLFTAGGLSSGQTVFLFGACLTVSLGFLCNRLMQARGRGVNGLGLWLTTSLVSAILLQAVLPWAGLCLPLVAVAAIGLLIVRKTLLLLASASGAILLCLVSFYRQYPAALLDRLDRWRCFFAAMFSNGYRFLYGLGFTNSSSWLCDPGDRESGPTFAHNIYAQIAADNGFFVLAAVVMISILLLRRSWYLSTIQDCQLLLPILSLALYSFLVIQIDAGWAQNSLLQVLIGFVIGSLSLRVSPETEHSRSDSCKIDVDQKRAVP